MQHEVFVPIIALLEEGIASGELAVEDPASTAIAAMGGLRMVATLDIVMTGRLDADARADVLVPQLMKGLIAR
jgi:hypothetical protein